MKFHLLPARGISRLFYPASFTRTINVPIQSFSTTRIIVGGTRNFPKLLIKTVLGTLGGAFLLKSTYENSLTADSLPPVNDAIKEADLLYEKLQFDEIYDLLSKYKDSNNDEILWRLARATYEKARASVKDDDKKALYAEGLEYLQRANEINGENFAVHKWMAILMDFYYAMEGKKARISHLEEMKLHMEKACELKPKDGTSWYVLGMWYYEIANLSWLERKGAAVFFATPPEATYEDALNMFLKAENVEPEFYSKNYLMIGKCLYNLGRKEESEVYFKKAQNYTQKTLDDMEARTEAEKWLLT